MRRPEESVDSAWRPARLLLGSSRYHVVDELVGGDTFGVGLEAKNDAVPEGSQRDGSHVVEGDVVATFQQAAHLAAEHQRLQSARTRAVASEALDLSRR